MDTKTIEFYTAEAFTERAFHGAQIAIFPHASDLSEAQMQLLAREMNLSESVFVTKKEPKCFGLRVFSPLKEVDFAGHPMIAAGHVLASIGEIDLSESPQNLTFQQKSGDVNILASGTIGKPSMIQFSLTAKATFDHMTPPVKEIADTLGVELADVDDAFHTMLVTREQTYLILPLKSFQAVRKAVFNRNAWVYSLAQSMMVSQVLLFSTETEEPQHDYHARLMGPDVGVHEDPPIGSSIPAFAAYLCRHGRGGKGVTAFSAERGTLGTRQSILNVEMDMRQESEIALKVGGPAISISHGTMVVPVLETLSV